MERNVRKEVKNKMQIPEVNIDYKILEKIEKVGDFEYSKGKWIICNKKKDNKKEYYIIKGYSNAVILSEILKLKELLQKERKR